MRSVSGSLEVRQISFRPESQQVGSQLAYVTLSSAQPICGALWKTLDVP